MIKRVSNLLFTLILAIACSFNTFANQSIVLEFNPQYAPEVTTQLNIEPKTPNKIYTSVIARPDGTGCDVKVKNVGIDGLDKVVVTVSASGHAKPETLEAYIPLMWTKTFSFDFDMIKSKTVYSATITTYDGGEIDVQKGTATLEYTETRLSGLWNRGTYSSRAASLEDHFKRHHAEVGCNNIVDYLNAATNYRSEVMSDLTNIRTSVGTGAIPSTKYKNLIDGRYVLLTDSGKEILSFGR